FLNEGKLKLAQQFICHNPARLPSPAQWVNVERIRLKDSYTHLWWMAATERPYADNRNVLKPYSPSMLKLLKTGKYNFGTRPSQHSIGEKSFLANNSGAFRRTLAVFRFFGAARRTVPSGLKIPTLASVYAASSTSSGCKFNCYSFVFFNASFAAILA